MCIACIDIYTQHRAIDCELQGIEKEHLLLSLRYQWFIYHWRFLLWDSNCQPNSYFDILLENDTYLSYFELNFATYILNIIISVR